jgi:hypothetical protein
MRVPFRSVPSVLALLALLAPATAQAEKIERASDVLKKELKAKEAAAKKDPEALCAAAAWAAEKGLGAESKRIYEAVLKIKPDHPKAHEALGNVLHEGKWVAKKELEERRKQALLAEMAAKGLVDVDGIWVDKADVDDAKRGVYRHDGEFVTKAEKLALTTGKVRHPVTGELIDQQRLEDAKAGNFPLGGDAWGDEAKADEHHANPAKEPWVFRSSFVTIVSRMPLAKVREMATQVDSAWVRVAEVFGTTQPRPRHRPVVMIAATQGEYADLGARLGDESSSTSAFLAMSEGRLRLPGITEARPAVCDGTGALGVYSARHAAGLAFAVSTARDLGTEFPAWFLHGVGSLTSRLHLPSDAAHYARQDIQNGGVSDCKALCKNFHFRGDDGSKRHILFQSGLMLDFALKGRDEAAKAALAEFAAACKARNGSAARQAIGKLEEALAAALQKLVAYEQELAR